MMSEMLVMRGSALLLYGGILLAGCRSVPAGPSTAIYTAEGRSEPAQMEQLIVDARTRQAQQVEARQIVRRGQMEVDVKDLAAARARLDRIAAGPGIQLAHSTVAEDRATYVLRVPAASLRAIMDSVATLGEVDSRSESAHDVTDQVIDVEARRNALRATRDRLRQLLDRGTNVQDVVAVERELGRVQGELDSLEGRLAHLTGQVALSELVVVLEQEHVLGPLGLLFAGAGKLIGKLFVWR